MLKGGKCRKIKGQNYKGGKCKDKVNYKGMVLKDIGGYGMILVDMG